MGEKEKALYLADTLQLEPGRFTLLLSTGGAGAQNHQAILSSLFSLEERIQVIALCGRDTQAKSRLDTWAGRSPFPVRTLAFTDEMPKLLQVASAVVARAGATTAGEALLSNCPIIFNGIGLMMPQELPTWRYFHAHGIGVRAFHPSHIFQIVKRWIDQPEKFAHLRQKMQRVRCRADHQPLRRNDG
jgi:processive 1,2-diacylglycerol beta-glucosyltransferase